MKAPLREFEVCSSNQDPSSDPRCYSLYGEGQDEEGVHDLIQHGVLNLPTDRQSCVKIKITGRHSYSRYKLDLGCRRGAYDEICIADDLEPPCNPAKEGHEVRPKGLDKNCEPLYAEDGSKSFSPLYTHSIEYDDTNDITLYTYAFLNKLGPGPNYPELSHAVLQYMGACSVSHIRVYTIENDVENTYFTTDTPGDFIQSPKSTVCMSGVDLPGLMGKELYYFELAVDGFFPRTATVDYVLKGGQFLKYGQTQGPDCRCAVRLRRKLQKRTFRGLPQYLAQHRRLTCLDTAVSVSEVKFFGKCNEG